MKKSDKENTKLDFDWSKLTLPQNKTTTNTHNNMENNNGFRPEDYLGEIQFYDDPKYYNFFISQDNSRVLLVSTNLDYKAENKYQKEYISSNQEDDLRFEAIIALIKKNSRSERNSSNFKTFLDTETGIQLEYKFLDHNGFKKNTVDSILENIIKPNINQGNEDENKNNTSTSNPSSVLGENQSIANTLSMQSINKFFNENGQYPERKKEIHGLSIPPNRAKSENDLPNNKDIQKGISFS